MPEPAAARPKLLVVRAERIRPLLEQARNAQLDLAAIFADARLPPDMSAAPAQSPIPLAAYFRLQQAVSRALADETFQMSARPLLPGTTDFVLSRLVGCDSLTQAMRELATHFNLLHGGQYNSVARRGALVALSIDDRNFPYRIQDQEYLRFTMECVQIYLHAMLASISEETADAALRRVSVVRARGPEEEPHLAFWRAPIRYGRPTYALEYDAEIMGRKIAMPPPALLTGSRVYEEAILLIERRGHAAPPPAGLAARVRDALLKGAVEQKRAAALLEMSVATLRRRLAEEGTSFRNLRRAALNDSAKSMLARRLPIADIAETLGFADFRSFNRAFRDWNGMTPSAWRRAASGRDQD